MINSEKLKHVLNAYRKDFHKKDENKNNKSHWDCEKYKWVAVNHFQKNWNIDADNFVEMFKEATVKCYNLLDSQNYFPRKMIIALAEADEKSVRKMFRDLFDESTSVVDRVNKFIQEAERIRSTYGAEKWNSHYQNVNSISTYLWLRYPDKYYIYKYSECKMVAATLESDFVVKKGAKPDALIDFLKFYNEIANELSKDTDTIELLNDALTPECYSDTQYRTLTIDVGFYISRYYSNSETGDENMNTSEKINHAWYVGATGHDENGVWTDFSEQYISEGRWENGYTDKYIEVVKSMNPGDKIAIKAAYTRKKVPFKTNGETVSVMGIKAIGTITKNLGDGRNVEVDWYKTFEPKKEWFFFTARNTIWHVERQEDDWVYGALLDFTFSDAEQDYERFLTIPFWKEKYVDDEPLEEIDDVEEVSEVEVNEGNELPVREPRKVKLHALNTILYGAPGTGKTYATAEYAMAILENREINNNKTTPEQRKTLLDEYKKKINNGQIVFTTFHQNYGYEDFIQGIRPDCKSSELKFVKADGVFKKIADTALHDKNNNYVIIIDEINRANISKVFGELITLIEDDKRWGELNAVSATLPMGDVFVIPNNLYIVGTMNTADKSISLIDTALRRRFDFVEIYPNPEFVENKVLRDVLATLNNKLADELDSSDLLIGHAYFIGKSEDDLVNIMNRNIIPLLYEYFYDNAKKVKSIVEKALEGLEYSIVAERTSRLKIKKKD